MYRYIQKHKIVFGQIFLSEILPSELLKAIEFNKTEVKIIHHFKLKQRQLTTAYIVKML